MSQDFWPFFPWFKPIWAPDKQAKVFLNSVLILPRYLITKLEKFDWVFWANCSFFCVHWANEWFIEKTSNLPGLGIISFAHRSFAHSLRSLKSNERLWVIFSDPSRQMSDCEQIAQVAHIKRATVSELLRLLMKNERPWAIHSGCSW